ncbi:protein-export chaperone SecB [Paenibacillus xylanexedens]|uniref:protein-export chaperone SecB n=1 Tax=Paenibacillus xylanexedens TaxID=528191 RepID=UPI0011A033FE|nr:protein-export chaperone SecB [Paenibacillus xylanexedens]
MLAAIQLKHYYVSNIQFKYSPDSEDIQNKNVEFSHDINYGEDDNVTVILSCKISDDAGLLLDVTLIGYFEVTFDGEDEEKRGYNVKDLCERNTLSILFPYLRSTISDVSVKANTEPIILPTINIVQLIEEQKERIVEEQKERDSETSL